MLTGPSCGLCDTVYLQEWEARREWRISSVPEIRIIAVLEAITTLFSVEKLIAPGHSVLSLLQCTGVHVHSKYADPYWIKAVVPHFLTDILWVNGIETSGEWSERLSLRGT